MYQQSHMYKEYENNLTFTQYLVQECVCGHHKEFGPWDLSSSGHHTNKLSPMSPLAMGIANGP
jgi:hypothetical protein